MLVTLKTSLVNPGGGVELSKTKNPNELFQEMNIFYEMQNPMTTTLETITVMNEICVLCLVFRYLSRYLYAVYLQLTSKFNLLKLLNPSSRPATPTPEKLDFSLNRCSRNPFLGLGF